MMDGNFPTVLYMTATLIVGLVVAGLVGKAAEKFFGLSYSLWAGAALIVCAGIWALSWDWFLSNYLITVPYPELPFPKGPIQ